MTFPVRGIALLIAAGGYFVSAPAAFFGASWPHHQSVTTPFIVIVVVLGPVWWRERDYLRLRSAERRRVDKAVRLGVPTRDPRLDAIALDRLQGEASSTRSDRIARALFTAVYIALPCIAAARVSPWFLLALLPAPLLVHQTVRQARREDPRVRFVRWIDDTGVTS